MEKEAKKRKARDGAKVIWKWKERQKDNSQPAAEIQENKMIGPISRKLCKGMGTFFVSENLPRFVANGKEKLGSKLIQV